MGLKPKQQLIKFLVDAPGRRSGVKGGRKVLAPALIEQVEGIEYGNWMGGWVRGWLIFHQGVYGVPEISHRLHGFMWSKL